MYFIPLLHLLYFKLRGSISPPTPVLLVRISPTFLSVPSSFRAKIPSMPNQPGFYPARITPPFSINLHRDQVLIERGPSIALRFRVPNQCCYLAFYLPFAAALSFFTLPSHIKVQLNATKILLRWPSWSSVENTSSVHIIILAFAPKLYCYRLRWPVALSIDPSIAMWIVSSSELTPLPHCLLLASTFSAPEVLISFVFLKSLSACDLSFYLMVKRAVSPDFCLSNLRSFSSQNLPTCCFKSLQSPSQVSTYSV